MAQSVPHGDIATQPGTKIVFNAPYDDKHTYHIKIVNSSARRFGRAIKTTNMKRLGVNPACEVLDHKEAILMALPTPTGRRTSTTISSTSSGSTPPTAREVPSRVVPGRRNGPSQEPAHRVQPFE